MKSKLSFRKKAIEPLIAAILLIVVAVILITIVLSWGKMFTTDALGKAKVVELTQSDAESFIYPKSLQDGILQFTYSPQSNFGEIVIESYKVTSDSGETLDTNLSSAYTLKQGTNVISLTDFSSLGLEANKKVTIILQTTDNQYVSIKNITNKFTKTSETPEAPEVPLSSEKNIISFTINDINGIIDQDLNTIAFELESGTNVTSLTPTITISEDATITPASGVSQNFTDSVTYTVTAEDNSTKIYTVSITIGSESIVDANLPYVMFGDSKLYIQPSGSNTNDGLGDADEYFDLCDYDEVTYNCIPDGNFPAKEYCEDLNAHGYDDWYLPSISQLAAIFESYIYDEDDDCMELWKGAKNTTVECINNAISETYVGEFVPLTDDDYYMSSTDYGLSSFFNLYLYYGHLNILSAGFNNYARCVRDDLPEEIVLTGDANLPYVKFGDSKLYIQPSGSNAIDGTGTDDITLNFENAKQFCSDLNAHGYDDWYVPSNTQWSAIIEAYKYDANDECLDSYGDVSNECINAEISKTYSGNLVNIKDAFYWSRTYADTYSNFYVDLDRLETNSDYFFEDESVYVRCVRDDNDLYVEPEPVILNPDTNLPYILGRDSKLLYIQPTDGPGKLNWVAAKSYCEDLNLNNYTDWYLPYNSQLEMMWHSCPDSEKTTSCMNGVIGATNDNFVNLKDSDSDYWSSTDNGETMAYKINMATGYTGIVYSSGEYNYRCVRDQ